MQFKYVAKSTLANTVASVLIFFPFLTFLSLCGGLSCRKTQGLGSVVESVVSQSGGGGSHVSCSHAELTSGKVFIHPGKTPPGGFALCYDCEWDELILIDKTKQPLPLYEPVHLTCNVSLLWKVQIQKKGVTWTQSIYYFTQIIPKECPVALIQMDCNLFKVVCEIVGVMLLGVFHSFNKEQNLNLQMF